MSPMKANPKRAAMEELMKEGVSQPEAYERVFGEKHASAQFGSPESNVSLEDDLERQKTEVLEEARDRDLGEISDIQRTPNIVYPPLSIPYNTSPETLKKALGQEEKSESETEGDEDGEEVKYASTAASDLAEEYGLKASDFKGAKPSSESGHTKADVEAIIAKLEAEEDEEDK